MSGRKGGVAEGTGLGYICDGVYPSTVFPKLTDPFLPADVPALEKVLGMVEEGRAGAVGSWTFNDGKTEVTKEAAGVAASNPALAPPTEPDRSTPTSTAADASSDLRRRVNYIFPALAIGVSFTLVTRYLTIRNLVRNLQKLSWQIFLAAGDITIIFSSYANISSDLGELGKIAWLATA